MDTLEGIGVTRFPLSQSRPRIFKGFRQIACDLVAQRIKGTLIIDGSFLTTEIEPDDIDFTLCVSEEFYVASFGNQRALMDWIGDDKTIKQTHLCDCYLCVECDAGSPMHFDGIQDRSYWTNLYRYSKVVRRERGIAYLHLNGLLL